MITINSEIANADALFERVKNKASTMNIDRQFYGEMDLTSDFDIVTAKNMHEAMLNVYQNLQEVNATWEIKENIIFSNRPIIGNIIVFGKRVFRKLVRWLYQPFIQQQIMFNGATVRTISEMIKVQELIILECEQREGREHTNDN